MEIRLKNGPHKRHVSGLFLGAWAQFRRLSAVAKGLLKHPSLAKPLLSGIFLEELGVAVSLTAAWRAPRRGGEGLNTEMSKERRESYLR